MSLQGEIFGDAKRFAFHVTRDEIAHAFNIGGPMINKLVRQGMPKLSHGKYDLIECTRWYVEFWRKKAAGAGDKDIGEERKALIISQTERTNLENAKLRGELIEAGRVAQALNEIAVIVAGQLDGLGARAAAEVAAIDDVAEVQRVLLNECRAIRQSIAESIQAFALASDSVDDHKAAAEPDGRPMGRRKPRAAARQPGAGAVA